MVTDLVTAVRELTAALHGLKREDLTDEDIAALRRLLADCVGIIEPLPSKN